MPQSIDYVSVPPVSPDLKKLEVGMLTYAEALLVLATKAEFKKDRYYLNVTVLNISELTAYFGLLKQCPYPLQERFVIVDEHWMCGEIKIEAEGHVSIFFLDSIGFDFSAETCHELLRHFLKTFAGHSMTVCVTDVFPFVQQRDGRSCQVFSLFNVMHLIQSWKFQNPEHLQQDIFHFLLSPEHHTKQTMSVRMSRRDSSVPNQEIEVLFCQLPLLFMRAAQLPSQEFSEMIYQRSDTEQHSPITSKGKRLFDCKLSDFQYDPICQEKRNHRIPTKLQKIKVLCEDFRHDIDSHEMEQRKLAAFTLSGLNKRTLELHTHALSGHFETVVRTLIEMPCYTPLLLKTMEHLMHHKNELTEALIHFLKNDVPHEEQAEITQAIVQGNNVLGRVLMMQLTPSRDFSFFHRMTTAECADSPFIQRIQKEFNIDMCTEEYGRLSHS